MGKEREAPILQEITAEIKKDKKEFSVFFNGKAGPGVSSGSQFGGSFGANSKEEAIELMKERAIEHADWLISYRNPDTDKIYKIDRKVNTILIIDGVKHDVNQKKDLTAWF